MPERTYRTKRQTLRARTLRREVSATERKLWLYLRSAQTGASFRRQHPIERFFLDYYCAPLKLAVEIDGPWHDPADDAERDAIVARLGIETLRFTATDIDDNIEGVVERIREEIWLRLNSNSAALR